MTIDFIAIDVQLTTLHYSSNIFECIRLLSALPPPPKIFLSLIIMIFRFHFENKSSTLAVDRWPPTTYHQHNQIKYDVDYFCMLCLYPYPRIHVSTYHNLFFMVSVWISCNWTYTAGKKKESRRTITPSSVIKIAIITQCVLQKLVMCIDNIICQ